MKKCLHENWKSNDDKYMFISLRSSDLCMHNKLTIIGSDNDLSSGQRQTIILTNL